MVTSANLRYGCEENGDSDSESSDKDEDDEDEDDVENPVEDHYNLPPGFWDEDGDENDEEDNVDGNVDGAVVVTDAAVDVDKEVSFMNFSVHKDCQTSR